ncbi:type II toxin-antitoxin system HicB family antitoxin [Enterococcus sp. ALS3]|uniref:Type II toxin-antitoxin system HicB family antitoxin n=1 Tax=Enterococcus alishanensis TaxID=1303817 RepID=A0ABS6TDR4_9ENTE|nr:type II toxin-antitoxin system HicB family antitoxin [Enterococcus alishanensis]MBV7391066.1 type II toxin-antitoxin system HicB family antitoxin [Enterococcus alishanensis]
MSDKFIAYPAIFKPLHNSNDAYFISFPDLPNTFTEGHGLEDSFLMASDVLAEMNYDNKNLPEPSNLKDIKVEDDSFVVIVSGNLSAKKREFQKYVRKNVTVPAELAAKAEEQSINFSQALTEALKERLGV